MAKILAKFKEKPSACVLSVLFLLFAALMRFFYLTNKPIHFDESINMWFTQRIWDDGFFTYDPTNYHGPLMFYMVHFVQFFTGFDFISTRIVAAFFSFLTLALLWFGPEGQRRALRWGAVILLLSPAMEFYGRSGIHESAFVFFQVLGFMSFHYLVARDMKKFWLAFGASLLGMMALKETFVVLILSLIPAFVLVLASEGRKLNYNSWWKEMSLHFRRRDVIFPLFAMLILFIGVYSGFGCNPKGLRDFFVALMPWLKTGVQGNGHDKPFSHWSLMLGQYEFLSVLGFFAGFLFLKRNKWIRFYIVFAFFLWFIYSMIPYKTPWCIISIMWPLAIVGGFAMDELMMKLKGAKRFVPVAVLVIVGIVEANILYQISFADPIKMDHPYVYVNSTYQMKEFIAKTQDLIREQPLLREQTVQIGTEESWPVPIVFYKFYNLSYFKTPTKVEDSALIYMVDDKDKKFFEEKLRELNQAQNYQGFLLDVRQSRAPIYVYVKREFFQNRFSWALKDVGAL